MSRILAFAVLLISTQGAQIDDAEALVQQKVAPASQERTWSQRLALAEAESLKAHGGSYVEGRPVKKKDGSIEWVDTNGEFFPGGYMANPWAYHVDEYQKLTWFEKTMPKVGFAAAVTGYTHVARKVLEPEEAITSMLEQTALQPAGQRVYTPRYIAVCGHGPHHPRAFVMFGWGAPAGPCMVPRAAHVPDMTGDWIGVRKLFGVVMTREKQYNERIEQCGDRIIISGEDYVHDFLHADSTDEQGCDDYDEGYFPACMRYKARATIDGAGCMVEQQGMHLAPGGILGNKITRCPNPDGTLAVTLPSGVSIKMWQRFHKRPAPTEGGVDGSINFKHPMGILG